jgi:small conductance mechanosensitive channel
VIDAVLTPFAAVTFDDVSYWARGRGLEIVLLATGALLLARFVAWISPRVVDHLHRRAERLEGRRAGTDIDQMRHYRALVQAASYITIALIYGTALLLILDRLNIPLAGLVASTAVAGVAIGFGAQRVVQDLLGGFFLFVERQYTYGDVIQIAQPGDTQGVSGQVEDFTLRTTSLRTFTGELVIIPNGEIRQVTNFTRDWSRIVIDIPLARDQDLDEASRVLAEVGETFAADPAWEAAVIEPPEISGVETIGVGVLQLRFIVKVRPAMQFDGARELRQRISEGFRRAGISSPDNVTIAPPETV